MASIASLWRALSANVKFGSSRQCTRSYGIVRRKAARIQKDVNFKAQKRRCDANNTPSVLIKGNLFTPEVAHEKEISVLCYKMVSFNLADCQLLTRYLQCAKDNVNSYRPKTIISILQCVSMYMNKVFSSESQTELLQESIKEERDDPESIRQMFRTFVELLKACGHKLKKQACRLHVRDLCSCSYSILNLANASQEYLGVGIDAKFNKLILDMLKHISDGIEEKFNFCGLYESTLLVDTYGKLLQHSWATQFLQNLSEEVSAMLLEMSDDLESLLNKVYIGDDLFAQAERLPKDLCNIVPTMAQIRCSQTFWNHVNKCLQFYIDMSRRDDYMWKLSPISIPKLALLANYVPHKTPLINEAFDRLVLSKEQCPSHIIMSLVVVCVRSLQDVEKAKELYSYMVSNVPIDFGNWSSGLKTELISLSTLLELKDIHIEALKDTIGPCMDLGVAAALYTHASGLGLDASQRQNLAAALNEQLRHLSATATLALYMNGHHREFPNLETVLVDKVPLLKPNQLANLYRRLKASQYQGPLVEELLKYTHKIPIPSAPNVPCIEAVDDTTSARASVDATTVEAASAIPMVEFGKGNVSEIEAIAQHLACPEPLEIDTQQLARSLEPLVKPDDSCWALASARPRKPIQDDSEATKTARRKAPTPTFTNIIQAREQWRATRSGGA